MNGILDDGGKYEVTRAGEHLGYAQNLKQIKAAMARYNLAHVFVIERDTAGKVVLTFNAQLRASRLVTDM